MSLMCTKHVDGPFVHDTIQHQEIHSQETKRADCDLILRFYAQQLASIVSVVLAFLEF